MTASRLMPFTPRALDADRFERETLEQIDMVERNLMSGEERKLTADDQVQLERLKQRRANVREEAAKLRELVGEKPVFMLRIPTPIERDQINSRLVELGLIAVSQEQIRASMIEALFESDWGKGSKEANETEAEELAGFMDGLWQREEVQQRANAAWQEQEVERMLDEANGAPARERAELPVRIITPRETAKAVLLIEEIQKTPRMRAITSKQWDFQRRNAILLVRIGVVSLRGLSVHPEIKVDEDTRALPEADVIAIRDALDATYGPKLGEDAWNELIAHIDSSYTLEGFEVKNFDSPLGKPTDQNGSIEPSGDTESNGGSSTGSSSSRARGAGSGKTTAKSSASTSGAKAASSAGKDTPTAAG